VTWCGECEWNLGAPPVEIRDRIDRIALAVARRLDAGVAARLGATTDLSPRWTPAKVTAYVIAIAVHVSVLALLAGGIALLVTGFPNVFAIVFGVALVAFAYLLRPRLGEAPREDVVPRADAPSLYELADAVAAAIGTRPPHTIVVDAEFGAYWMVAGIRRARVLALGLPLVYALDREQLVALVAHEVAHGRNGDSTRGLVVGSSVNTLSQVVETLDDAGGSALYAHDLAFLEAVSRPLLWLVARPFVALLGLQYLLLHRDSQRAEYLADSLAAEIAGTRAVVQLHESLLHDSTVAAAVQRAARENEVDVFSAIADAVSSVPPRERERRRRVARLESVRLSATHPPVGRRIALLEARPERPVKVALSGEQLDRLHAELASHREDLAARMVDAHRASLY
jgi:Zn-dependent protease with chaperone function